MRPSIQIAIALLCLASAANGKKGTYALEDFCSDIADCTEALDEYDRSIDELEAKMHVHARDPHPATVFRVVPEKVTIITRCRAAPKKLVDRGLRIHKKQFHESQVGWYLQEIREFLSFARSTQMRYRKQMKVLAKQ